MGRVLLTGLFQSQTMGGTEQVILQLATSLQKMDWDIIVALTEGGEHSAFGRALGELGIEIVVVRDVLNKADVRGMYRLTQNIRAVDPEIAHIHLAGSLANPFLPFAVRLAGVPAMVITEHSNTLLPQRWLGRLRKRLTAVVSDQVVAVSQAVRQGLVEFYGLPARKVSVINNGVNVRAIAEARTEDAGAKLRERYKLSNDTYIIGCVAALQEHKGHTFLLKATPAILAAHSHVVLMLVGDGSLRWVMEQEAHSLGILDRIIFAGWQQDIAGYLHGFDLFVLPSLVEGMPLAILEAMAAGLPIVATNVGGTSDVIQHEVSGLLVPPHHPYSLTEAILRIIDCPDFAKKLGTTAQSLALLRFDVDAMIGNYVNLYQQLLARRSNQT